MTPTDLLPEPEHIAISKSKGINIDWKDGLHSEYGLDFLRENCPCAGCTGVHGGEPYKVKVARERANPLAMYKPSIKIDRVEPVGTYAIRIHWNDGHSSGIYTWTLLRELAAD